MTVPWNEVRSELGIDAERQAEGFRVTAAYVTGYRLGELRRHSGLTQMELAERMKIGQPRVSSIERCDLNSLTVGSVRAYVEALGGTVDMVAHVGDLDVALDVPGAA